MTTSKLQI